MASNNGCEGEIELPLIDLSLLNQSDLQAKGSDKPMSSPLLEVVSKIREACQEWGFFRVINHGIEAEVIQRTDSAARDLFALPTEVKEKLNAPDYLNGYTGRSAASPYNEGVSFPKVVLSDSVHRVSGCLWPEKNPEFCKAMEEYSSKVDVVAKTLIKLTLMGLGFEVFSEYYESFFEKSCSGDLRMNYYSPPTNNSQLSALPLGPHTDFSFISLLCNDRMAGLEIQSKEGDWFSVKPLRNSLAVFVGDSFQIWSNCRYRSVLHRVVYKGWSSRLSLGYFVRCADETELCTPQVLIDDDHPQQYKPFIFRDYVEYKLLLRRNRNCPSFVVPVNPFLL